MTEKSKHLIELLNSYQNNSENFDMNNNDHEHHEHHDTEHHHRYHKYNEENTSSNKCENVNNNFEKNEIVIKYMEKSQVQSKSCTYLMYNGYRYRREILDDDTVTWEIERFSLLENSSYNVSVFYRIFHDKQIDILEKKYGEIN